MFVVVRIEMLEDGVPHVVGVVGPIAGNVIAHRLAKYIPGFNVVTELLPLHPNLEQVLRDVAPGSNG